MLTTHGFGEPDLLVRCRVQKVAALSYAPDLGISPRGKTAQVSSCLRERGAVVGFVLPCYKSLVASSFW